jgi:hypothetical protein
MRPWPSSTCRLRSRRRRRRAAAHARGGRLRRPRRRRAGNSTVAGKPAQRIGELPLEWFYGPGVRVDFTARADGEAITAAGMGGALEAAGHRLQRGDIVLAHSGRDSFYGGSDYMERGPGVTVDATRWPRPARH